MATYRVVYVPDEVMEADRNFVLCNQREDGVTIYMRRGIRLLSDEQNAAIWEAAWAAFRELADVDEIPQQRHALCL